jgi:hypothetical protein
VGRHFLTTLLRSLRRKVPRLAQFAIDGHHKQRYEPLMGSDSITLTTIKVKRHCKDPMTLESMPITSSNLMKLVRTAYDRLEQLAQMIKPFDAFEVVLGDYLDLVALQSVQRHHVSVSAFFANCFSDLR